MTRNFGLVKTLLETELECLRGVSDPCFSSRSHAQELSECPQLSQSPWLPSK